MHHIAGEYGIYKNVSIEFKNWTKRDPKTQKS